MLSGCAKEILIPEVHVSEQEAELAIKLAEVDINEAEKVGADVTEARSILNVARRLLKKGDYNKAKKEAERAGDIARCLKEEILVKIRDKDYYLRLQSG